jgi:hypothetical protein
LAGPARRFEGETIMAHIGRHPAPGMGELLPGSFVVPSNPILGARYIPHLGELLPASFAVPQNPLIAAMTTPAGTGMPNGTGGSMGCGCSAGCGSGMCGGAAGMAGLSGDCGCIGGMCGCGMSGLGVLDPATMALLAGALVLTMWMVAPGGKEYHRERERLRETYQRGVRRLKGESRGYRRIARGTVRAAERGVLAAKTAVA